MNCFSCYYVKTFEDILFRRKPKTLKPTLFRREPANRDRTNEFYYFEYTYTFNNSICTSIIRGQFVSVLTFLAFISHFRLKKCITAILYLKLWNSIKLEQFFWNDRKMRGNFGWPRNRVMYGRNFTLISEGNAPNNAQI